MQRGQTTLRAKNPTTFRLWRDEVGLTRKQAALLLGLSEGQVLRLDYAQKSNPSGKPQKPSLFLRYAMRAIKDGLEPWPE